MRTGEILDHRFTKTIAVMGPVLAAGIIAMAFAGLISLRPGQATIHRTDAFAKEISYQQAAVIVLHPNVVANTISGEHCQYNTEADIRVCRDLETGPKRRDMIDINGKWSVVGRE
jgi:hypothetical protein